MTDESNWQRYEEDLKATSVQIATSDAGLPDLLYHYTSAEACFSIIDTPMMSKDGPRLWASCALGMNDATEIRYGLDLVHDVASQFVPKEELERSFAKHWKHGGYAQVSFLERTCVACFCEGPDLLSQWRAYGKDATGYCLGFRRELLSSSAAERGFRLVPITYERERQVQKVQRLFEEGSSFIQRNRPEPEWRLWRMTVSAAIDLSLGFKHACFSEEREWRLISPNPQNLKFRACRWGIIPYVEVALPKRCLASIWQGPTLDYDLTRRTLEMYLRRTYGCNDADESVVQICRSEIPLRKLDA